MRSITLKCRSKKDEQSGDGSAAGPHVTESLVDRPRHIYGVDFSGAVRAGKKVWIARGAVGRMHLPDASPSGEDYALEGHVYI